jgi:hypothetical protein
VAAYDPRRRRIGCVLLQAVFGGDREVCFLFPPGTWLTTPTKGMRMLGGTRQEWEALAAQSPLSPLGLRKALA